MPSATQTDDLMRRALIVGAGKSPPAIAAMFHVTGVGGPGTKMPQPTPKPGPTPAQRQAAMLALAKDIAKKRAILILGGTGALVVGALAFFKRR
jgi:hypothetical protein